jgi:hypothetical protein
MRQHEAGPSPPRRLQQAGDGNGVIDGHGDALCIRRRHRSLVVQVLVGQMLVGQVASSEVSPIFAIMKSR